MMAEFGNRKSREEFHNNYGGFVSLLPSLKKVIETIFNRTLKPSGTADLIIFRLGNLAVMDFDEIVLLCANGHGLGALKILRGLYESTLTCRYLALNPEEAQDGWIMDLWPVESNSTMPWEQI